MAKKSRKQTGEAVQQTVQQAATIEQQPIEPIYRQFTPRPCTLCETRRPHNTNASYVYCTRGKIRFCKCKNCGHTWSQEGK